GAVRIYHADVAGHDPARSIHLGEDLARLLRIVVVAEWHPAAQRDASDRAGAGCDRPQAVVEDSGVGVHRELEPGFRAAVRGGPALEAPLRSAEVVQEQHVRQQLVELLPNRRRKDGSRGTDDDERGDVYGRSAVQSVRQWARHGIADQAEGVDML